VHDVPRRTRVSIRSRLCDDVEIGLVLEHRGDGSANGHVIIDEQDACWRTRRLVLLRAVNSMRLVVPGRRTFGCGRRHRGGAPFSLLSLLPPDAAETLGWIESAVVVR
jgi:hypothetical protein